MSWINECKKMREFEISFPLSHPDIDEEENGEFAKFTYHFLIELNSPLRFTN